MTGKLSIGCPVWACEVWKGELFTKSAPRAQWLHQYSQGFNTVEGNSTFYALPSIETATKWAASVAPGFHFALKMPRVISHESRLLDVEADLAEFLEVADVLYQAGCLGPSFLQLPPDYSPRFMDDLERFLRSLPSHMPWSVEVRHPAWFDSSKHESALDELLRELSIDKVIFDSRPLYSKPPSDEIERASQTKKPKTPVRTTVTGQRPFLRLIGRNNLDEVQPWIDEWSPIIANWLRSGLDPYVFTHAPDDRYAPRFARRLHEAIQHYLPDLPAPNPWPGENERPPEVQLTLF